MTRDDLFLVAAYVKAKAAKMNEDAGYNGSWSDGGASELNAQAEIFISGLNGKLPNQWDYIYKQYQKENDPEYQTYLQLKKKFG